MKVGFEPFKEISLGRDLNPRPRPYQGRAIPLSHQGTVDQRVAPKYHGRHINVSSAMKIREISNYYPLSMNIVQKNIKNGVSIDSKSFLISSVSKPVP